tara:strand:- start:12860 stop:13132 length:273 start_codon:yes stop_codon:yes gene_type:complete
MKCIKTGCHLFLANYGEFLRGDAFEGEGVLLFRISDRSRKPLDTNLHFTVKHESIWFDKDDARSTLLAYERNVRNHGYQGKLIKTGLEDG